MRDEIWKKNSYGNAILFVPGEMSSLFFNITIKAGSFNDGIKPGLAHFVEHMVLCVDQNEMINSDILIKGRTSFDRTSYTICTDNSYKSYHRALLLIDQVANGDFLRETNLNKVKKEILEEYNQKNKIVDYLVENHFLYNANISCNMPIGIPEVINNIKYNDIQKYFRANYYAENIYISILGGKEEWKYEIDNSVINNSRGKFENVNKNENVGEKAITINLHEIFPALKKTDKNKIYLYVNSNIVHDKEYLYVNAVEAASLSFIEYYIELLHGEKVQIDIIRYSENNRYIRFISENTNLVSELKCLRTSVESKIWENAFRNIYIQLEESLKQESFGYQLINNISEAMVYGETVLLNNKILNSIKDKKFLEMYEKSVDYIRKLLHEL